MQQFLKFMRLSNQLAIIAVFVATLSISVVNAQEPPFIQKLYPFSDSTAWVELKTFKDLSDDLPNVEVAKIDNTGRYIVDLVKSMFSTVDLLDMNSDGVSDLLVSFTSGGRANTTYHLYLVKLPDNLIKVNSFENIANPKLDLDLNVIIELRLTAQSCYRFHRISNERLISLDTTFCEYPDRSVWRDDTMAQMNLLLDEQEKPLKGNQAINKGSQSLFVEHEP